MSFLVQSFFVVVWKLKTWFLLRNKHFVFAVTSFISSPNSKSGVFEKNIKRFRGNLGKNQQKKFGGKVRGKPESGLGIFREN